MIETSVTVEMDAPPPGGPMIAFPPPAAAFWSVPPFPVRRMCEAYPSPCVMYVPVEVVATPTGRIASLRFTAEAVSRVCRFVVSCDMAAWISGPVAERCPQALRCVDSFHVIQLGAGLLEGLYVVWGMTPRA
jgi:hypothetical protein